jgi:hypothetical protein
LVLREEVVVDGSVDKDVVLATDDAGLTRLLRGAHDMVECGEEIVPEGGERVGRVRATCRWAWQYHRCCGRTFSFV